MITRILTAVACLASLPAPAAALPQIAQERPTYFYSGGRKVEIAIAADRIAVRLATVDSATAATEAIKLLSIQQIPFARATRSFRVMENEGIAIIPFARPQDFKAQARNEAILNRQAGVLEVGQVVVTGDGIEMVMTNELVARFHDSLPPARIAAILASHRLRDITPDGQADWRILEIIGSNSSINAAIVANRLTESNLVAFAHPNFIMETASRTLAPPGPISSDPLLGRQWHLESTAGSGAAFGADVRAIRAWANSSGRPEVTIAILDDAIEISHPDLKANIRRGRDLVASPADDDPSPGSHREKHGTSVAGLAAAAAGNGIAGAGVCPRCSLLPIRMLGGPVSTHALAIEYAVSQNADIISNSWGYPLATPLADVVTYAITKAVRTGRGGKGAIVLFAAPNDDIDFCATEDIASAAGVISVSGTNSKNESTRFGWGRCLDVVAPTWSYRQAGTIAITTTSIQAGTTDGFSGTSAATPIVAGTIGLLLSIHPELSAAEVRNRLRGTADKIGGPGAEYDANGFSLRFGYGRVNAEQLLARP